jgi:hypothetical protein
VFFLWLSAAAQQPQFNSDGTPQRINPPQVIAGVPIVSQATPVWCWLASTEMILRYYNFGSLYPGIAPDYDSGYQCALVATMAGPLHPCWQQCGGCVVPAGHSDNITYVLKEYPDVVRYLTRNLAAPRLKMKVVPFALSKSDIKGEIDAQRPVLIGISPSGVNNPFAQQLSQNARPEHAAVIVGYQELQTRPDGPLELTLVINDPFPYHHVNGSNPSPYQQAGGVDSPGDGQHVLRYEELVHRLLWSYSWYRIEPVSTDQDVP